MTLTADDVYAQIITGTSGTGMIIKLPDLSTIPLCSEYSVYNLCTGTAAIEIQTSSGLTKTNISAGGCVRFVSVTITGAAVTGWKRLVFT